MDPAVSEWLNLAFRWMHVVAGVTWIGLLYYFNWINGHVIGALDAETKQKVVAELLPRTLYWFRWGALYTFITGYLLLGLVYYMGGLMVDPSLMDISAGAAAGIGFGTLMVGSILYDALWRSPLKNHEMVAVAISFLLIVGATYGLTLVFAPRAAFMHVGGILGTAMAHNVWMVIWPNQRKIMKATQEGSTPKPEWGELVALRSKHNTYLSAPVIFLMLSSHYPGVFASEMNWALLAGLVAISWFLVKLAFIKSAGDAPKAF